MRFYPIVRCLHYASMNDFRGRHVYGGSNKVRVMTMRRRRVILGRVFAAFDGSGECVFFRNTMFSQDFASTQKVVFSCFSTCVLFAYFEGEGECFRFVYT